MLQWTVVGGKLPSSDDTLSQNAPVARPTSVGTIALANVPDPTITSLKAGVITKLGDEMSSRRATGCVVESLQAASATAAIATVAARYRVDLRMSFS
jgi:hypothetical protein